VNQENSFFDTPVKKLVGRTRESVADWMLKSSDYVSSLLSIMTLGGYHRVLVIDEECIRMASVDQDGPGGNAPPPDGCSIVMLTQTDMLKYLSKFLNVKFGGMPIFQVCQLAGKLGVIDDFDVPEFVVKCSADSMALVAYRLMFLHRKNAIAIVDKEGRIISNLSASDLRGLHRGNIDSLLLPVYEFLETNSRERNGGLLPDQLRTAKPDTPLDEIVQMILDSRIHRVWITNDNDEPVGVISITDILCLFSPENAVD
jgi:CBS domain-containing protein